MPTDYERLKVYLVAEATSYVGLIYPDCPGDKLNDWDIRTAG